MSTAPRDINIWSLSLLGGCILQAPDGTPVKLATRKAAALLALLAMAKGRSEDRTHLAALLWENAETEQARVHLRKAIWLIRSECQRAAPDVPPPIEGENDLLTLAPTVAVDVDALLTSVAEASSGEAIRQLYAGDFLAQLSLKDSEAFEEWAATQRRFLRAQVLEGVLVAGEREALDGPLPDALATANFALTLDPLQERAHRIIMRSLHGLGRPGDALQHYRGLTEQLRRELDVEPEMATEQLHGLILSERRVETPTEPLRAPLKALALPAGHRSPTLQTSSKLSKGRRWVALGVIGAGSAVAAAAFANLRATEPQIARIFPVVPDVEVIGRPALSPDGRQLIFTGRGEKDGDLDLFAMTVGDRAARPVTTDRANDDRASWSPDGRAIAFLRSNSDGTGSCRIIVASWPSRREREVGRCAGSLDSQLAWTGDGESLLLADADVPGRPTAIVEARLSGVRRVLTKPPSGTPGDRSPVVLADGKSVAFLRLGSRETAEVMVLDRESGEVKQLTRDAASVSGLALAPDGRGLLFSSDRGGDAGLWWVSLAGGAPKRLSEGLLRYGVLASTSSGRRLLFEGVRDRSGLEPLENWRDAEPRSAEESEFRDWSPDVSPNGTAVFVSTRSGGQQLWVQPPGQEARPLTRLPAWHVAEPRWSPDGTRIAFVGSPGGKADIYVVHSETGRVSRVTNDQAEERSPVWAPGGRGLYYVSRKGGGPAIWRLQFGRLSAAERISSEGINDLRMSLDGRWLYYTMVGRSGVYRRAMGAEGNWQGPAERFVATSQAPPFSWGVGNGELFLVDRSRVVRVNLASKAISDLGSADTLNSRSAFAVRPRGGLLLNPRYRRVELYGIDFS